MEGSLNPKTPEEVDVLMENFAVQEGMPVEDLYSDILTFAGLSEEDPDADGYLDELQDRIGISKTEIIVAAERWNEKGLEE